MTHKTLRTILCLALSFAAFAQKADHPTGSRITPPSIREVSPLGISRGTTVELTVEGFNLAKASGIYFSEPGIKGRILRIKELPDLADVRLGSNGTVSTIDLGPLPPRNQVTVEVDVEPAVDIGAVKFRLQTPLGTSPEGQLIIEPYFGESVDREPNDTPEAAVETFLPAILSGAISKPGDTDHYKITVKAGEEVVFQNGGTQIGSALQPVVAILAEDGTVAGEYGRARPEQANAFSHKFDKAGTYYVRVSDYQLSGRASNFYRYKAGKFPIAGRAYPLGLRRGETKDIALTGYGWSSKVAVKGEPASEDENMVVLRPKLGGGKSYNLVKLALGDEPEVESAAAATAALAQQVTLPVTINGRIDKARENYFRFSARKGQQVILEVNARRLESELDSEIEVLDAKGKPIERATVRSVSETYVVLRDHDSVRPGIRIQNWSSFAVGDYLMIGSEIVRINALPRGPDDDFIAESFGGQRITYFGTSGEAHANDQPVYKVQIHPPGTQFSSNGLPLVRLSYRNDDGGPGYGKDSYLQFTAPADGDYIARIRDVRGSVGPDHAYRLTLRGRKPDFRLTMNPRNPNIPQGGTIPVSVTAQRRDDFDGPIEVTIDGLPQGVTATRGFIGKGQINTVLLLTAADSVKAGEAVALKVTGRANIDGRPVAHAANPGDRLKLASIMPKPDLLMTAETREVELEAGGTAQITVTVARQRDYGGRVPVQVLNLPPRVRVLDVGLNGVLVNEDESRRSFTIEALPSAEPVEQVIYVAGTVETRSPQQSLYAAPQAIRLRVKAKSVATAAK
ncbi:MAG: PPC domain-containing protein [Acidobacteria bacterium]|nr:PPC domain-containing protein [Acidobacteriota bacterium]